MALVQTKRSPYCGGAIISRSFIVTAAHCIWRDYQYGVIIVLGMRSYPIHLRDVWVQYYRADKVLLHERFVPRRTDHDLALLRIGHPGIEWSVRVQPICLPEPGDTSPGGDATVIGWGLLTANGPFSDILKQVMIKVLGDAECQAAYPEKNIQGSFLCAGVEGGGKDACQGDSGGPLMVKQESGRRWVLIGVVSFGRMCGDADSPGVYTNVSAYIHWIRTQMHTYPSTVFEQNPINMP